LLRLPTAADAADAAMDWRPTVGDTALKDSDGVNESGPPATTDRLNGLYLRTRCMTRTSRVS